MGGNVRRIMTAGMEESTPNGMGNRLGKLNAIRSRMAVGAKSRRQDFSVSIQEGPIRQRNNLHLGMQEAH